MPRFLILSSLGMLLLSSCEPGGINSDATDSQSDSPKGRFIDTIPTSQVSRAQLSARDSLGKPPLPLNMVSDVDDVCPVHGEKMKLREVPIVFEDNPAEVAASANPALTAAFPFGAEKIISLGNALLPTESHTARVYQCAACVAARRNAEEKRMPVNSVSASK